MKEYRAVLFDLDGTLLNTLSDLTASVNFTLGRFGFPTHEETVVRGFIGNGIRKLIERALPPAARDEVTMSEAYALFSEYYAAHCADRTAPYAGMPQMIEKLHKQGRSMSVVSNKDEGAARLLCDRFYPGAFTAVIGGRRELPKKPDPTGARSALDAMRTNPRDALYVGDSAVDFDTAKNAGTDCALVGWGFGDRAALQTLPVACFASSPAELLEFIERGGRQ